MSYDQCLLMDAVDYYVLASNRFTRFHSAIRNQIENPLHPASEIAEIYSIQLRELFEYIAVIQALDISIKTTCRLRKPNLYIPH
jgi:hypothetical protein